MKALNLSMSCVAVLALLSVGSAAPKPANELIRSAEVKASAAHKNVMVIFHASWCGWCHKLEGMLADPKMGRLIRSNYELVTVDVLENGDKKSLENTGGLQLMEDLNGKDAGLPFVAVISPSGKLLANSNAVEDQPKTNIGYPAKPDEIQHFVDMLKASAPKMGDSERASIQEWLTLHAPKAG